MAIFGLLRKSSAAEPALERRRSLVPELLRQGWSVTRDVSAWSGSPSADLCRAQAVTEHVAPVCWGHKAQGCQLAHISVSGRPDRDLGCKCHWHWQHTQSWAPVCARTPHQGTARLDELCKLCWKAGAWHDSSLS